MPLRMLDDERLYVDHAYYRRTFRWTRDVAPGTLIRYHFYWHGRMTRHHELCLKSLFLTQSAPLEVWLWLTPESFGPNQAFLEHITGLPGLHVKRYVLEDEAPGTLFEGRAEVLTGEKRMSKLDGARVLTLLKYGGLHVDFDLMFLRDLRPLCAVDFCYSWSIFNAANTAVFHAAPGSAAMQGLAERSLRITSTSPRELLALDKLGDLPGELYVLPMFLFDPVWLAVDLKRPDNSTMNSFDEFFTSRISVSLESFFPESYVYHWHNRWQEVIAPDTIAGQLFAQVNERFSTLCTQRGWATAMGRWTD